MTQFWQWSQLFIGPLQPGVYRDYVKVRGGFKSFEQANDFGVSLGNGDSLTHGEASKECDIRTNNVPRPILNAWDLSHKERSEFSYLVDDNDDEQSWIDSGAQFFRYRGEVYSLSDFVCIVPRCQASGWLHGVDNDSPLLEWDGIATDSYFSGVVVRYCRDDSEMVVVGLYTC